MPRVGSPQRRVTAHMLPDRPGCNFGRGISMLLRGCTTTCHNAFSLFETSPVRLAPRPSQHPPEQRRAPDLGGPDGLHNQNAAVTASVSPSYFLPNGRRLLNTPAELSGNTNPPATDMVAERQCCQIRGTRHSYAAQMDVRDGVRRTGTQKKVGAQQRGKGGSALPSCPAKEKSERERERENASHSRVRFFSDRTTHLVAKWRAPTATFGFVSSSFSGWYFPGAM